MMDNKKEFYNIKKENLAKALNFLGFKFYVWNNKEGQKLYGFEKTKEFDEAYTHLLNYRKELNLY